MSITLSDSFESSTNATVYTISGVDIGTASSSRVVYALVAAHSSSSSAGNFTSVTIGGINAVEIGQRENAIGSGKGFAGVFAAVVPTGTTADIVATCNRSMDRFGGMAYISYNARPEASAVSSVESANPSITQSRDTGGTIAFQMSAMSADNTPTGGTTDATNSPENIIRLNSYTVTADTFSTAATTDQITPILFVMTFPLQATRPFRPHQKTDFHLRDSAQLDFGANRKTVTNNGASVSDDVFTFTPPSRIDVATTFPTSAFSFSLWYKVDQTGTFTQRIIGDRNGNTGLDFFFGAGASGTVNLSVYDGVGTRTIFDAMVRDGEWHHLVAGRTDAGDLFGYLDGVALSASAGLSHTATTGSIITVGSYPGNSASSPYKGDMADIRVVDYALTAGEVFDMYNEGRGFDLPERKELPDTRLHLLDGLTDAGFYGAEVTNTGVTYENGVYGGFGGTNNLRVSADTVSGYDDQLSFAAWIKPTSYGPVPGGFGRICSKGPDELEIITKGGSGQPADSLQIGVNGVSDTASGVLTLSEWQHLAVSITSTVASVYIDGALVDTLTVGTLANASSDLGIGNRIDGSSALARGFIGDMADIHFSHNALTAGEVANLYRKGIPALRGAEVLRIDPARYSGSGDLIDQTGGGNDLTLPSGYSVTGDVIVSDGTADGPNTGVSLASSEGTIAFWVNTTDTVWVGVYSVNSAFALVVEDGSSSIATGGLSNPVIYVDGVAIANTRQAIYDATSDGMWHHVAITADFGGGFSSIRLFQYNAQSSSRLNGQVDKLLIANTKYTADQIAFLAKSREFADPFPVPFGNLGGETLSIQPSRYTGSGDLLDQSGNGNDLTLPSGYSVADGVIVSDGTANGPAFPSVDMSSSPGTIAFWIKTTDATVICVKGSGSGYCMAIQDNSNASAMNAVTNGQHYVDAVAIADDRDTLHAAISDGEWHHFAFTGDFDFNFGNIATLFGFSTTPTARLTGEVDDIRFESGRKWSAEEIKLLASARGVELPNTRDAKLAVLPSYDDASNGSTSVLDYSGNQNTGTLTNGPTWNTSNKEESGTRSIEFGTDQNHHVITNYNRPQSFDISIWLAPDGFSNRAFVGDEQTDGSNEFFARFTDAVTINTGNGIRSLSFTVPTLTAGDWQHVHLSYLDATSITLYLNGVLQSTQAWTGSILSTSDLIIGGRRAAGLIQDFDGLIDDVLVYDRVLTPAEIARFSEHRNIFGPNNATVAPEVSGGEYISIFVI